MGGEEVLAAKYHADTKRLAKQTIDTLKRIYKRIVNGYIYK